MMKTITAIMVAAAVAAFVTILSARRPHKSTPAPLPKPRAPR